jgi:hypothetical protein
MPGTFDIFISYSQIAVFPGGLEQPFNDWTREHVNQGFAWRPEAVSFKTLQESGNARISWELKSEISIRPDAIRAIQVPFFVPSGSIEIASITDGQEMPFPEGEYLLVFETGLGEGGVTWCCFSFVKDSSATAAVLKIDKDLAPHMPLLMEATPAK